MRISGTYFDRLIYIWMPIILAVFGIALACKKVSLHRDYMIFLDTTVLFWTIDILFMVAFRRLKPLIINGEIKLGQLSVSPSQISAITPVTYMKGKLECKTIEFRIHQQNKAFVISVMDKPMTFIEEIMGKESKTLAKLFDRFPELEKKLHMEVIK